MDTKTLLSAFLIMLFLAAVPAVAAEDEKHPWFCDQDLIVQAAEARNEDDYVREFRALSAMAETCPAAMWRIGYMHEKGVGRAQNPYQAFKAYAMSQAMGYCPTDRCDDALRMYRILIPNQQARAEELVRKLNMKHGTNIHLW